MQIRLKQVQFTDIEYKVNTFDPNITHRLDTSLGIKQLFSDESDKDFAIEFNIQLKSKKKEFKLKLKATAHFSATESMNEEFKASPFTKINAPAIAFPYIRTFISNFTLNSGYDSIILPSFNFVQLSEAK